RRQIKGRTLPLEQLDEWRGGAAFWSPARVQRARSSLSQQEAEALELQHQKARQKEISTSDKQLKARLLQERRVARAAAGVARARQRADEAADKRLRQQARKEQSQLQKRIKLSQKGKKELLKPPRRPLKQKSAPVGVAEPAETDERASIASTSTSPSGRAIRTPSRFL
ncbi:uncharacterized protein CC84DRAFT_1105972, partial [Paraphaeosphaeria sporulosa]